MSDIPKLTCRACGKEKEIILFSMCQRKLSAPRCSMCLKAKDKERRKGGDSSAKWGGHYAIGKEAQ